MNDSLKEQYLKSFGPSDDIQIGFCPYRVCPLGAHVDHQKGLVTGFALNIGIRIAYSKNVDGLIQLVSNDFTGKVSFNVQDPMEKKNDWADYIRGALKALSRDYHFSTGLNGFIQGDFPIGGLSSSAAVIISFMMALCKVNGIELSDQEIIEQAFWSETQFVGVSIGKLDQSCEVLSKKNKLLFLDTLTGDYKLIPQGKSKENYGLLIIHSGVQRKLVNSSYNVRVDECKSAAYALKAFSGIQYGKYSETVLRDIDEQLFIDHGSQLPLSWKKRALHFFGENERVRKGIEAWKSGDIFAFGKLVTESGESSIQNYEAGSPLLIDLFNIIKETKGVFGGRFMGGGFNGCCLAIVNSSMADEAMKNISNEYLRLHPEYIDKMRMVLCTSEDGVGHP